eukprot:TRINITY_DN3002_c0_g1_i14.p1 TRINITY_DN3002_c0_g1~~TRINITY_DN3002_c0_g1_i14.p1  ORF type:complete len:874 (-),score=213.24 TRINITY_DN3002_c0_g1_i14:126-2747(-)
MEQEHWVGDDPVVSTILDHSNVEENATKLEELFRRVDSKSPFPSRNNSSSSSSFSPSRDMNVSSPEIRIEDTNNNRGSRSGSGSSADLSSSPRDNSPGEEDVIPEVFVFGNAIPHHELALEGPSHILPRRGSLGGVTSVPLNVPQSEMRSPELLSPKDMRGDRRGRKQASKRRNKGKQHERSGQYSHSTSKHVNAEKRRAMAEVMERDEFGNRLHHLLDQDWEALFGNGIPVFNKLSKDMIAHYETHDENIFDPLKHDPFSTVKGAPWMQLVDSEVDQLDTFATMPYESSFDLQYRNSAVEFQFQESMKEWTTMFRRAFSILVIITTMVTIIMNFVFLNEVTWYLFGALLFFVLFTFVHWQSRSENGFNTVVGGTLLIAYVAMIAIHSGLDHPQSFSINMFAVFLTYPVCFPHNNKVPMGILSWLLVFTYVGLTMFNSNITIDVVLIVHGVPIISLFVAANFFTRKNVRVLHRIFAQIAAINYVFTNVEDLMLRYRNVLHNHVPFEMLSRVRNDLVMKHRKSNLGGRSGNSMLRHETTSTRKVRRHSQNAYLVTTDNKGSKRKYSTTRKSEVVKQTNLGGIVHPDDILSSVVTKLEATVHKSKKPTIDRKAKSSDRLEDIVKETIGAMKPVQHDEVLCSVLFVEVESEFVQSNIKLLRIVQTCARSFGMEVSNVVGSLWMLFNVHDMKMARTNGAQDGFMPTFGQEESSESSSVSSDGTEVVFDETRISDIGSPTTPLWIQKQRKHSKSWHLAPHWDPLGMGSNIELLCPVEGVLGVAAILEREISRLALRQGQEVNGFVRLRQSIHVDVAQVGLMQQRDSDSRDYAARVMVHCCGDMIEYAKQFHHTPPSYLGHVRVTETGSFTQISLGAYQ